MLRSLIITGLFVAIAGTAWYWVLPNEQAPEVKVVRPERGYMESTIRVTGRVINDRTVSLTALIDGRIEQMLVGRGDLVKTGQTLAVLDGREAEALLDKAKAVVARGTEEIRELTRKLQRLRDVLDVGGATTQIVEDAEADLRAADARLQIAREEARIAGIHLDKTKVTAPFAGIVTEKVAEVGQWVEAGIQLFTLVAQQGWEIEANVDAADSGRVRQGLPVNVSCDCYPGLVWKETVHWTAKALNNDSPEGANTFAVRITLGTGAPSLLLGQQVDVKINTAQRQNALKLPYGALIETEKGLEVAILRQGKVHRVPIVTGVEDLTHTEIVSGLSGDEVVILPRGKTLTEGERVMAVGD
jgi:RND family efflux transporter MFP subunit